MIIKKFIGKTEEEAHEAAKRELGAGIVIMNVKEVKKKGLFAIWRPKQVEVTVALEEEKEALERMQMSQQKTAETAKGGQGKMKLNPNNVDPDSIEKKLDSLQNLLEKQIKNQKEAMDGAQTVKPDNEANAAKEESKESGTVATDNACEAQDSEQEKFLRLLYNTMLDNEIDEKYANQIMEEIEKSKKPNTPMDYILANVYQKMILKFGKSDAISEEGDNPKVVIFIGPTGVGKTTTIAKLASYYAVEKKKKVALLTSDTYRIAAAEQLRTYANILEVPFRVIYTEEEMQNAIRDFTEYDYIFVDTAGHSHQNDEQLASMKKLLDAIDKNVNRQTFLVVSATTKYRDLLKIAKKYQEISDYQLIFTKLDETTTLGNLLNLKLFADTSIAYVTCGQNVPDDIEKFNPQKTVKQLLGGKIEK